MKCSRQRTRQQQIPQIHLIQQLDSARCCIRPADTATDDSVIDIGTEDYLEIPEEGQSNDASEADNAQDAQAPEEVSYAAEAAADTASEDGTAVVDFGTVDAGFTQEESNSIAKTVTI